VRVLQKNHRILRQKSSTDGRFAVAKNAMNDSNQVRYFIKITATKKTEGVYLFDDGNRPKIEQFNEDYTQNPHK